jgi:hypothetical protein
MTCVILECLMASLVTDAEEHGGIDGVKRLVELAAERVREHEATDQS